MPLSNRNSLVRVLLNFAIFGISLLIEPQFSAAQVDLQTEVLDDNKTYLLKTAEGKRYAGRVDDYDKTGLVMTRRNGRMVFLPPEKIKSIEKVDDTFYSKSFDQMKAKLQQEFGSKYVVSRTRHFLVVHPPGDYETWALPFEQLYKRFQSYFKTRGLVISEPEFPMVAIVLRTQREFVQMAGAKNIPPNVVGYYAFRSNRLIAYQQKFFGRSASDNWASTMDTIVHEATHQTASNTGVHSRAGRNPRWVTEGLATMFEAKGINNYFEYPEFKTRINWERLHDLRKLYKEGRVKGTIEELVLSDRIFERDPQRAYAVAWALSLYLAERNAHRYVQYLEMLQDDPLQSSLTARSRGKYFFKAFGKPIGIEADLKRFVDRMPQSEDK